jgi:hypothetical protein
MIPSLVSWSCPVSMITNKVWASRLNSSFPDRHRIRGGTFRTPSTEWLSPTIWFLPRRSKPSCRKKREVSVKCQKNCANERFKTSRCWSWTETGISKQTTWTLYKLDRFQRSTPVWFQQITKGLITGRSQVSSCKSSRQRLSSKRKTTRSTSTI